MSEKTNKTSDTCPDCNFYKLACICESEQKTYDSEPVTFEEIQRLQEDFYSDDISGGLQNIEVPEEELERQREQWEYAQSFIDMSTDLNVPCYKTDKVSVKLTPEQIVILIQILENYSLNMQNIQYLEVDTDFSLYQQQVYVNLLRDRVEENFDEYVRHRPYSPFLPSWFKKIGKDDVDKDI